MLNNSNILASEIGMHMDLGSCYKALLKYHHHEPKIEIAKGFEEYKLINVDEDSFASHEAGFDALITGYVFLKSLGILSKFRIL